MSNSKSFIFYDGDKTGDRFADRYLSNDLRGLQLLSLAIEEIHIEIRALAVAFGAVVIESGGDEGLLVVDIEPPIIVDGIRRAWSSIEIPVTIGLGHTPREAFEDCRRKKE